MIVKPVGNRVMASQVNKGQTELPSGLVMPDTAKGDELVLYRIEAVSSMVKESKSFDVGMFVFIPRASPTARINEGSHGAQELDLFSTEYIVAKVTGE